MSSLISEKKIKVGHFCKFTPSRSGQFESTKEMILGERLAGIDAQFIDCGANKDDASVSRIGIKEDSGFSVIDPSWALEADILVRHTIIPSEIEATGKPIVMCLHGRPENSFLLELYKKTPVYSLIKQNVLNPQYVAFVTFWKEFEFNWRYIIPSSKLFSVPSCADITDRYKPGGKLHSFGGNSGKPNLVIADVWREDTVPYNIIHAAAMYREIYQKTARVHVFGIPSDDNSGIVTLLNAMFESGVLGQGYTLFEGLETVFRAADIVLTSHNMATRIVRECLACGTPIVAGTGCPYTPYTADARNYGSYASAIAKCWQDIIVSRSRVKESARLMAEKHFSMEQQGLAIRKIYESLLNSTRSMRFT